MIDGKIIFKLGDFGLAKTMYGNKHTEVIGSFYYSAPEQKLPGSPDYTNKVDVYSMGAILFELLVGKNPIDEECYTKSEHFVDIDKVRSRLEK